MKPILRYPGAKWKIAPWIVSQFPRSTRYIEPFFGSGAVFFHLPWQPRHVVLNDRSGAIVNLFRVLRDPQSRERLIDALELTPWARDEYDDSMRACDEPIEQARRFLVRCWQSHGTRLNQKTGWRNIGKTQAATVSLWNALPDRIRHACTRLKQAEIEHRPALEVIARYPSSDTLIYADPPYPLQTRSGRLYEHEMSDEDHSELLDLLDQHPGPVVISGYACDLYTKRLAQWTCMSKRAQAENGKEAVEMLWLNAAASCQLPLFEE